MVLREENTGAEWQHGADGYVNVNADSYRYTNHSRNPDIFGDLEILPQI